MIDILHKKAAYRKSDMLLDSYIHGNGTYDFLSCKRHHQIFALFIILLQIKKFVFLYARIILKKFQHTLLSGSSCPRKNGKHPSPNAIFRPDRRMQALLQEC